MAERHPNESTLAFIESPTIRRGSGAPLLDGNKFSAECALFASNLVVLAYAPAPYGLAIDKNTVSDDCTSLIISPPAT